MSLVAISGNASGTGTLTIAAPNTNNNYTLTLPEATGALISTASTFAGTGPAFSAYAGAVTSLSGGGFTKVLFNTEEFDTNSNFASSRFTPTVAGYYQINSSVSVGTGTQLVCSIYKNGSEYKRGVNITVSSNQSVASSIVYCDGSTDYVEIFVFSGVTQNTNTGIALVYFNGSMVRAA
jgi:hypothetical protein